MYIVCVSQTQNFVYFCYFYIYTIVHLIDRGGIILENL